MYNANFQYGTSLLDGEILVKEYKSPTWFYEKKNPKVIKTLSTVFRFSEHWTLKTGLRCNFNEYYMAHQLKLNENGLENIDGQTPIQQNGLVNGYLGIPVELYFNWGEPLQSGFSVNAFFGRRTPGSSLKT